MAVKPIPEGYPRVSPYLVVDGAQKAIEFYTTVLGFTERMRMPGPDGRIGHAELQLGDSLVMVADEVMSGFGRTGRWVAVDHDGVTPDLLTCAKGLTGGYAPGGAVLMTERIARHRADIEAAELRWLEVAEMADALASGSVLPASARG